MKVEDIIIREKVIAVTVFNHKDEVAPVMDALLEGGIRILELALRSEYSLDAISYVKEKYPEISLGIGTVLSPEQVLAVVEKKANFAVAPGLNRNVLEKARSKNLPFFPGVATASDVEAALEYDIRLLKLFPAEPMGGISYLKTMNAPYAHLGIKYIPLGGVNAGNLKDYLSSSVVGGVGGSWIASRPLIEEKNWKKIQELATEAIAIRNSI